MGETVRRGADLAATLVDADDILDAREGVEPSPPATFPAGSEVHDLDGLLAAYLLDLDVTVPRGDDEHPSVLLLEPDLVTRRALAEMLEVAGHRVITAETAIDVVATLAHTAIDLVLADAGADASGKALRHLLLSKRPGLPVIIMTDDPVVASTWSPEDLSAVGFVQKPVRGLLLLAAIRDAVQPERRDR